MNDLSKLPSVDKILSHPLVEQLQLKFGRGPVLQAVRTVLERIRTAYLEKGNALPDLKGILDIVKADLEKNLARTLIPVINTSGVIIHTNLGRSPLSRDALQAVKEVGQGYSSLEFDLDSGGRGSRLIHAESQFQQLVGAESALIVNNNAAAVLLALTVLTRGKKVIISRSQLVEIGGGFRIPEVLRHSGTELIEVGTTNKVHLFDYQEAYNDQTAAVMRAHRSNYSIVGFTSEPELQEIVASAHQAGVWFFDDLGSGALLDTQPYGLKHEPMVQESLAADADLVCFSGDKLLGGPQAGIILGKKELIDRLKVHPLARAIRADKLALAALTATLDHYIKGEALSAVPVWRMISASPQELKERVQNWQEDLGMGVIKEGESKVGGGSLPGESLPTWVLALDAKHPNRILEILRKGSPAVVARVDNDQVLFDPRTVLPEQDQILVQAIKRAWSKYED